MFDYCCVYYCLDCKSYWAIGPNKRRLKCDNCGSKNREQTASLDPSIWIPRLLNENHLEVLKEIKNG